MCLVVHKPFPYNGRQLRPGDVLFGDDADNVSRAPGLARYCTAADDRHFTHLKPPPRPRVLTGGPRSTATT